MRDFEAYYAAGSAWDHHEDPYSRAVWNAERTFPGVRPQRYEVLPFVAPPAVLPLLGALAAVPAHVANVIWRCALIVAIAALVLLTVQLTPSGFSADRIFAVAIAAVGFGPLTSGLALGQLALPAYAFTVLALFRPPAGFFAWVQPNIALALIAGARTKRSVLVVATAAISFGVACTLVSGVRGMLHYVHVLQHHSLAERFSAIQITPASIAYGFGASANVAVTLGVAVAIAAACCWAFLTRGEEETLARFCLGCALLPLVMPFFHEHDLIVLFVPAIIASVRASARFFPLAALGSLFAATDWLGLAQRPGGTLQTLLLAGAFGLALVALQDRIRIRKLLVPGVALACIGGAAWLAHTHPAPVWPDAMHALPPHVARMDVSSAWHAEQLASGLLARDPVWALLRCLSLLGGLMIALAAALSSRCPADSRSPSPVPAAGYESRRCT